MTKLPRQAIGVIGHRFSLAFVGQGGASPRSSLRVFGEGGGRKIAEELGVDFLGEVPIDPRVVEGGDKGEPIVRSAPDSPAAKAFLELGGTIARKLAVLAVKTPPIADGSITWVTNS